MMNDKMILNCNDMEQKGIIPDGNDLSIVPDSMRTVFPYLAIAYLQVTATDGTHTKDFSGTGFMISKNCLLTAAHVIHYYDDEGYKTWFSAQSIQVVIGKYTNGLNIGGRINTSSSNATYYYCPNYVGSDGLPNKNNDYGYIYIWGDNFQYFGQPFKLAAATDSQILNSTLYMSGYVYENGLYNMYVGSGRAKTVTTDIFRYNIDSKHGMSGGPVYLSDGTVYGIHCGGPEEPTESTATNYAHRISQTFINELTQKGLYP